MVAAEYVDSIIQGNEIIGLTWARALLSLVRNLHVQNYPELKVVQMLGGLGEPHAEFHGADLTRRMAQSFGTRPWLIQSPGIVKNKEICDELKNDIQVKDTLKMATKASLAIVGIGLFSEKSQITRSQKIINKADYKILKYKGVVGDISLRFFNKDGKYIDTHFDERVVGISTDEISKNTENHRYCGR
jgi:DNA-binding transcriptional regulator LsrR (DeoR family)